MSPTSRAAISNTVAEGGEIEFLQSFGGGVAEVGKSIVHGTRLTDAAPIRSEGASADLAVSFELLNDIEDRDFGGGSGELIASTGASDAVNKSSLRECGEDFRDKGLRPVAALGDLE